MSNGSPYPTDLSTNIILLINYVNVIYIYIYIVISFPLKNFTFAYGLDLLLILHTRNVDNSRVLHNLRI